MGCVPIIVGDNRALPFEEVCAFPLRTILNTSCMQCVLTLEVFFTEVKACKQAGVGFPAVSF